MIIFLLEYSIILKMICNSCGTTASCLISYNNTYICNECSEMYGSVCDTCGLECDETCLEFFTRSLQIS